ncbi:hypothetical protein I305_04626 [Cryptococcus gattii E566]|uniref:Uncharacterized protein n=2 Tax=Cryptococcus gattii TaxID=37769 RepID=E6RFC5_CRYGW|nr:Hypothetical Protein CGB_M2270C [Cryptococcus gattii WM276]ADV25545.1 Hypothetical Protein CGB_M2270C [Cryptococcus gattii WM276]KIR78787.1 hypothetical protein I306_04149 [Cryptococcus gattii EJB2]KIY32873.1 hypothetical protein I305_04626 [Cryptococcus gattii E566]KJE05063.1 hypothetical protein I311_01156 [Cryptococcus gattii NT-10]
MLVLGCADTAFAEMTKTILKGISPDTAPKTIGPYVHAMIHQETVFTTCIIPLDPKTDELIGGKAEDQFVCQFHIIASCELMKPDRDAY